MNLVVGATGVLGSEICRLLALEGKPARALVRPTSDQGKVAHLESLNVEIARGDLKDRASLDAACAGATTVISTASSIISRQDGDSIESVDLEGQLSLIDAAKAAGCSQFVLISFPEVDVEFPLQTAKRKVEEHLKASGLTYTILQPTCFMEAWLSPVLGFDAANGSVQIYGSGENKMSWISYKDVAKFAAASLENREALNKTIKLGGPDALTALEVVRLHEELKGQKFNVQFVPQEALKAEKESATDSAQESFAGLMLYYSLGDVIEMRETLNKFPMQLTSVRDYAQASMQPVTGAA